MAGGGGGAKKFIINYVIDNPVKVYFGGAALLFAIRTYQTKEAYNHYFGKADFQRKVERE